MFLYVFICFYGFIWVELQNVNESWLFPSCSFQQGERSESQLHRWTSRTWVRRMQWIPGRQRVRCFCKEITLVKVVKVDCINLCIWYIYIYTCVGVCYIYVYYIFVFIYIMSYCLIYIYFHFCVCLCVCVRSVACGRPNPQDRDVLTSELMDLDPHKLLTLVKRIWRYWKLTANRRSSVITRYNKPSGKSSRFITLGYVGVFFHTFSHVFTFILAMACWLDRRSCQRTSRA